MCREKEGAEKSSDEESFKHLGVKSRLIAEQVEPLDGFSVMGCWKSVLDVLIGSGCAMLAVLKPLFFCKYSRGEIWERKFIEIRGYGPTF